MLLSTKIITRDCRLALSREEVELAEGSHLIKYISALGTLSNRIFRNFRAKQKHIQKVMHSHPLWERLSHQAIC
jgi:hypothetical protein